ncbi:hypothetical protein C8J56DRAFT_1037355 [Mycena floridula]|nr:hypothetical protein C8J56DRAFT_1037355 [Mycena floridula]
MSPPASSKKWSIPAIRKLVWDKFKKRACWTQLKIALALWSGKDVIGVLRTGGGKTLSFWIALLMALEEGKDKMIIIVTPLNLLGKQNERLLSDAGISSKAVDKDSNSPGTWKDIVTGKYCVVTVSPELLGNVRTFGTARNSRPGFCTWCLTKMGNIHHLLPPDLPFYVASATLPPQLMQDVILILRLRADKTELVYRSNDRTNIHLIVHPMLHTITSYEDLAFLIAQNFKVGDRKPRKFLIFFNSTTETEDAVRYLHSRLPPELRVPRVGSFIGREQDSGQPHQGT